MEEVYQAHTVFALKYESYIGYTVPLLLRQRHKRYSNTCSQVFQYSSLLYIVSVLMQDSMHLIFCHKN